MLRFAFLTLLSFLFNSLSSAQSINNDSTKAKIIYSNLNHQSWIFSYKPNQRNNNNRILNQLALAHLKVPEKTSFTYNFIYEVEVKFQNNDSLQVDLTLFPESVSGDRNIKHFNIEKILKPSIYNVHLSIVNARNETIIDKKITFQTSKNGNNLISFPDSLWKDVSRVNLSINDINFSDEDFKNIELELLAIRDYYAAVALGDSLIKKIRMARTNTTNLDEVIKIYASSTKGLYLLNQSLSSPSKIVPGDDPLELRKKIGICKYTFKEYLAYLETNKNIDITGNVYTKIAKSYIQSLKDANRMSQLVDYYSSTFFYKLYSNAITSSQLNETVKWLSNQALSRNIRSYDIMRLSTTINREYLKESERLLLGERYVEAVDLLTGAKKFSALNPFEDNSIKIDVQLKKARAGLVISYTNIIQKALDKQLLTLAEKYLTEVEDYTEKYELGNSETSTFGPIYEKMAEIHSQIGFKQLEKKNYRSALDEFHRAKELASELTKGIKIKIEEGISLSVRGIYNEIVAKAIQSLDKGNYETAAIAIQRAESFASDYSFFYPDISRIDSIKNGIATMKYKILIKEIGTSEYNNLSSTSVSRLIDLASLCQQHYFKETDEFDSLVVKLGLPHVNYLFSLGKINYENNKPDSALYFANEAYNVATLFQINNSRYIKEKHAEIVKLASEIYCKEANIDYNTLMQKAKYAFSDGKFNDALILIKQARELVYAKSPCGLSTTPLNKLLNDFQNHIQWDEMIRKSYNYIAKGEFENAANLMQQAEAIYTFYHLDSSNLKNITYYNLAFISENEAMVKHAISYLMIRGKLDNSFELLDKLRQMGISPEETKDIQESLARNLSIRDKKNNPDLNIKNVLNSYTKGDKWYRVFDRVYLFYINA